MKRPAGLLYAVDETPPPVIMTLSAVQHVAVIVPTLITPLLLGREAGLSNSQLLHYMSLSMLGLAIGTFLLCVRSRYVGSSYLCPGSYTANYLGPALFAIKQGGLPLAFGMVIVSGLAQLGIAPLLRRLRFVFPTEIAGLIIAIVGLTIANRALQLSLGIVDNEVQMSHLSVALLTLVTMVFLNVWTGGFLKILCALLGILVGVAASYVYGLIDMTGPMIPADLELVRLPSLEDVHWSFDLRLLPPFLVACIGATLKLTGDVVNAQRLNDAEWVRPGLTTVRGGVVGAGLATVCAGLLGNCSGITNNSASVGLSGATGITSRTLGYAIAGTWAVLALVPAAAAVLVAIPRPVMGAALFFSSVFLISNGLQMVTTRMLDPRKTIVIGFSLAMAVLADLHHDIFSTVPPSLQPIFDNGLTLGTVCAVMLNLVMRVGIRKREVLRIEAGDPNREVIEKFLSEQGGRWGARRDVVNRAIFGAVQVLEVIGQPAGGAEIEAGFDEFNLDLRIRYQGEPLKIPDSKPTPREIMGDDGEGLLAGYLLRRSADRISSRASGGRAEIHLHYDH